MVRITISSLTPSTPPTDGWKVGYRIKGSTGGYTSPVGSPFTSLPIVFDTLDPAGTLYEGYVKRDCGTTESSDFLWVTACNCTTGGYVVNETGTGCKKVETIPAIVTNSGYCLAPSVNGAYGNFGTRIYNFFSDIVDWLSPMGTTDPSIYADITTAPQWCNPLADSTSGPLNREGVWIDSNCDGNRDALTITSGPLVVGAGYTILNFQAGDNFTNVGAASNTNGIQFVATGTTPTNWTNGTTLGIQKTTLAFIFNNTGIARTIYVGVGGDNQFKLVVNGTVIADTGTVFDNKQFKIWHIFPITIGVGINYFNVIALGDGSPSDSIGMVIYDNTPAQLIAATNDSQLNILYKTSTLRGTTYDVATCQDGYNLDTSGGSGSYVCTRVLEKVCNTAV